MPTVRENSSKNKEFHIFLGLFPRFPVDDLEDETKTEFQICVVARNLNEEQRSNILQGKNFPTRLQIHGFATLSFLKMLAKKWRLGWKMVAMTSLKMRNLGFESFFEYDFSDSNHCLK